MNKTQKINFILIVIAVVYTFIIGIIAIKQHFKIKTLQDNNADYQRVIADYKKDLNTPEYMAFDKCKGQGKWLGKCIDWELNK